MAPGEGAVGWGDVMQIVGPLGNASDIYYYYHKSNAPDPTAIPNEFYWGDENCDSISVSFDGGDGVAIDNPNEYTYSILSSGQVPSEVVEFAAHGHLNWTGNPFPAEINLNAIALDDGVTPGEGAVGWGDVLQIVGPLGNASEIYYYYHKSNAPDPTAIDGDFYWGDENCDPVNVILAPGAGVAIDNPNDYIYDIKITPPYSL